MWPPPKFYFSIGFADGPKGTFAEVSGLDTETQSVEYRHGDHPVFSPIKKPRLGRVGNVTLHRGVFGADAVFWDWHNRIKTNTSRRATVVIHLLDETGAPKYTWTLNHALPTKLTGPDLESEGNEVAIETLEIAYETLVISAP